MGTVIGSFIGGLLAIGIAVLIYRKITSKKDSSSSESTPADGSTTAGAKPELTDNDKELSDLMDSIAKLNISIRTTYGLPIDLIQTVEKMLDLLKDTVPQMMERYPAEPLTYELKRISMEHLPQITKEFVDLSEESMEKQYDAFLGSLNDVLEQIKRANEIVENNVVAEFKVMASFLKTKYSSGDI